MSRARRPIVVALAVLTVPLAFSLAGFAARAPVPTPWLARARAQTTCILPREQMRQRHMAHLKSLRDRVVRQGDRSQGGQGLTACRGCHTQRAEFCDRCHAQAGVTPDCFGCHAY
jgi:hypothetical protein